ncbi:MAG: EpsG family protein [Sphingomonadales bacterium]|nr:EpsG family protein [Sphingomonadales bacterium]
MAAALERGMLIYWLMFAYPALFALVERPGDSRKGRFALAWGLAMIALVLLIGLRWETGGDWGNYDRIVQSALWSREPITLLDDPAFTLLTRFAAGTKYGMLTITMVSGLFMAAGLTRFSLAQPRPWLCLAVAVPYLVVVLGMGYIRQGMAVSLFMVALAGIGKGSSLRYALWIVAAAMFHSTAIILLPLVVVISRAHIAVRAATLILVALVFAFAALSARAELFVTNYVDAELVSAGAVIRLFMTALPAAILIVWRDRFILDSAERRIVLLLSLIAIVAFALVLVFPASTVIDRTGLYLLPLQCLIYARLPEALGGNLRTARVLVVAVVALYAASFFVWLNYAVNVSYWLPYRFFPLEESACLEC